jgi:Flp pilus assembly pilin Flp
MKTLQRNVKRKLDRVGQALALPLRDEAGQGVAEYIIILAVIVVAAIVLAIAFHDQLKAVWDSVTSQLGSIA